MTCPHAASLVLRGRVALRGRRAAAVVPTSRMRDAPSTSGGASMPAGNPCGEEP
jgi:hypothetical protein